MQLFHNHLCAGANIVPTFVTGLQREHVQHLVILGNRGGLLSGKTTLAHVIWISHFISSDRDRALESWLYQ